MRRDEIEGRAAKDATACARDARHTSRALAAARRKISVGRCNTASVTK